MNGQTHSIPLPEGLRALHLAELTGDLAVQGSPDLVGELRANVVLHIEGSVGDGVGRLSAGDDLQLIVPAHLALNLAPVRGDTRIDGVSGPIEIAEVNGDLRLRAVRNTRIGKVYGDLRAQDVDGDVLAATVYGDAVLRRVAGSVTLERVQADAVVRGVTGCVQLSAGADANVELLQPAEHRLQAGADLRLNLGPAFGGRILMQAGSEALVDLPQDRIVSHDEGVLLVRAELASLTQEAPTADAGEPTCTVHAGAGGDLAVGQAGGGDREGRWQARVEFKAMGEEFRAIGDEFRQLAEKVTRRVQEQMGGLGGQLQGRLSHLADNLPDILSAAGLSLDEAERVAERVRSAGERASLRAQERMEQVRRRQEAVGDHRRGSWDWIGRAAQPPAPPTAPPPPAPPAAASEERLAVLRLLESGRISTEEAERLLRAMFGQAA